MSMDLFLKSSCGGCGSSSDLYGSNCKHMTLCLSCGKKMAEAHAKCFECGTFITRLIREYHVKASTNIDKTYYIGRFTTGLPSFSKKKNAEARWSLHREGLQGRQLTDSLREKYKNKPWLLEDETGQYQYHGHVEGAQSATYYLLMMQGKEFVAIPAGSWYNFNKVAQYKQLTLEEAEEKMKNRRRNAEGYQRWMMKIAANGAAAFGETLKEPQDVVKSESGRRKKGSGNEKDDVALSDKDEEKDGEEEESRKRRLGLNKKTRDDDEEGPRGGDLDFDDDDIEKGDDWEHEENFTDDDEAVGNDPEERDELPIDVPAPPEIKQDDEEEEEGNEEGGGLSKSGKELKKLLGRASGLNDSDEEDDDEDDDIEDEVEVGLSPVLAPKQKEEPTEESMETNSSKTMPTGPSRGTPPASKSVKTKRKSGGDDMKGANGTPLKKLKTENESKPSTKDQPASTSKTSVQSRGSVPFASKSAGTPSVGPVTEDEIRAVLLNMAPVTTQELVANFRVRLKSQEDKGAFADILKKISKIQKTNGSNYVVLRDK